jgi:hypothetical protein
VTAEERAMTDDEELREYIKRHRHTMIAELEYLRRDKNDKKPFRITEKPQFQDEDKRKW